MTKLFILLLLSLPAHSTVRIELNFTQPSVSQGEIIGTKLLVDNQENIDLQLLLGQKIANTVYFQEVGAPVKQADSNFFEVDAKVIFIKVPEAESLKDKVQNADVVLGLKGLKVDPTQAAPELVFGTFSLPRKMNWIFWGGLLLGFSVLILGAIRLTKRIKSKRAIRQRRQQLRDRILGCRSYEDIVELWKSRREYSLEFPHIEPEFDKLSNVLNRHQFKPKQSEAEKIEVVEGYKKFVRSVEGGFIGV